MDEHTAALDPKTAAKVLELSDRIVAESKLTTPRRWPRRAARARFSRICMVGAVPSMGA